MWLETKGVLVYDPPRPGLKKKRHWWCVVEADDSLTDYYRHWVQRELHLHELCQPSWGAHVSVVRGEQPPEGLQSLWGKYEGEEITFRYKPHPRVSGDTTGDRPGNFWFLDVECERLQEIRTELGLPTYHKFHITIGRRWSEE